MAAAVSISWTTYAWEDYLYWQEADQAILSKINELLKECVRTPFTGRGKPEPTERRPQRFLVAPNYAGAPLGV